MTDFLRDLAVGTGGRYTPPGTYDLASYLSKVTRDENEYYLLGFAPPPESVDKPCHKIKVKVDRSDLRVDARDTYCSSVPLPKALEARLMAAVSNAAADVQLSWFYSRPGTAVVNIAMNEPKLMGVAYRPDGSVAARFTGNQFSIGPGEYRVRVAAGAGVVERRLDIPPWDGQSLMVSGIALSVEAHPLIDVTSELDSGMLEGPRRLAANGRVIVPMAGTQFPAGKDGLFYFEIYHPGETPPAIRTRILDRTGEVKYENTSQRIGPIAMTLPVSQLPAGTYTLEVRINDLVRAAEFSIR